MRSQAVTVGTTATLVVSADDKNRYVYLHNPGGVKFYLGNSTVSTADGFHLDNGISLELFVPLKETVYAVVASGSHAIVVLEPDVD